MEYVIHLSILFCIYAILGLGLNLIVGYTGLLSVSHAAFFGMGAYSTAILMTKGFNFFAALLIGAVLSSAIALLIGLVLSKFKDDYYALCSLGFNVIVFSVLMNWQELTRGPLGIPGIKRPDLFGFQFRENFLFLILATILLAAVYFISQYISESSFGRVLKAIREDEKAIQVFGYNTHYYKLVIFVVGAAMASIAGSLFASYISYIDPSTFTVNDSIFILAIIILGGLASLRGTLLGALILIILPEALRFIGLPIDIAAQLRQLLYGLILILLMVYQPRGLIGEYKL